MDKGKLSDISFHGTTPEVPVQGLSPHRKDFFQKMPAMTAECLLALHQQMASTLDPSEIIHLFMQWLKEIQWIDSVGYLHPTEQLSLTYGSTKPHNVHYTLQLEDQPLGELIISRKRRFLETELQFHEIALAAAAPYLRNALDHQTVKHKAFHDSLTGIMNRSAMEELLAKEVTRAQRHGHELSIIVVDIDNFKKINDEKGHIVGDLVLKQVSQHIKNQLRNSDLLFRYGGDEFIAILPNTGYTGALHVSNQISDTPQAVATRPNPATPTPKLSIGFSCYQYGEEANDLIHRADQAMYEAKRGGFAVAPLVTYG
ncbi:MAG: GGDEF domain-containing protein [Porticoccaceae bacterium]